MAAKCDDDEVYHNDLYKGQEVTATEFDQFIEHLSYGLHSLACHIIGDEDTIRTRRQVTELHNEYQGLKSGKEDAKWYRYLSGSISEGFRFSSSDLDYMYTYRHVKVIHSITNHHHYDDDTTVLLMESDKTRPGYALLRLIGNAYDSDVKRSLVPYPSETYVSSQIWRELNPYKTESEIFHGPCNSGIILAREYDHAYCLHSSQWPFLAYECILRLLRRKWPPIEVIQDIVTSGVNLVPISAKQSKFEFVEWRLSFSVAEKKLVHSMNHTQFMCYGLLKIFLKEAINIVEEINSIICSFYLKNVVFWEILNPSMHWIPNKLYSCFWRCFTKIIDWIDNEYLPNFFIPENNMLIGKFHPGQKEKLMNHLNMLHGEGYACLLRCPSLHRNLFIMIQRPLLVYTSQDWFLSGQIYGRDIELIVESQKYNPPDSHTVQEQLNVLQVLNHILSNNDDPVKEDILRIWWQHHSRHYAILCHVAIFKSHARSNTELYHTKKVLLKIIDRCGLDCVSHLMYIALCFYRCDMYEHVIRIIQQVKVRLQNPNLLYLYTLDVDKYKSISCSDTLCRTMLKRHMALNIRLSSATCIPELKLEHHVVGEEITMFYPPLVMVSFLECLSNFHLGLHHLLQDVVSDLHTLVHYDDGHHVQGIHRAISWQILGICQEMARDYWGAFQSYSYAINNQYSLILRASRKRLKHLLRTNILCGRTDS